MSSIDLVIESKTCVGCGGCGAATQGRIPILMNQDGYYEADLTDVSDADKVIASLVCPFADESRREDDIALSVFPPELPRDQGVGHYGPIVAGRISDDQRIPESSSGGLTNWLVTELLRRGEVDGVIHVGGGDEHLFDYVISRRVEDVQEGRKSKYYPVSFDRVLNEVRGDGRTYAFVGIPCVIRSARLVTEVDPQLARQLKYFVGIVCGHLKTKAYAESFAWQLGVPPEDVADVDFRIKNPAATSREYSFGVESRATGEWRSAPTLSLVGGSWGHAVFQLNACNYCDDIFAETADVVFGDAWLSKYEIDWRGTNVVISRNKVIDGVIADARAQGVIQLDDLTVEEAVRTQAGNFRHRRQGLAVRLADDEADGRWSPRKRVSPSYEGVDAARIELIRQRRRISAESHGLFRAAREAGKLETYLSGIQPLLAAYQRETRMPFGVRLRNKLQREAWKLVRRLGRRPRPRA